MFSLTVFEKNSAIEKALPPRDMYAMYLRKSRADIELEALGEGETLARHKTMLEALAAKHNISMNQITVYKEMVSGDSIDERPEMQRLLEDVYAKKYKGVLVVEVERLARGNTKDQGEVADAFQFSDTHIITPAKVYDPHNEFDQEYFEFGLFMSRREYKTIRRRMETGKLQAVKEGNYIPSIRPFGYNIVKKSKKERTLAEHPDEGKIVRMIFDWYTEDRKPTSWIAKQLTIMGIPTIRKRDFWERATIKDMLHNPIYIGKVTWGKQKTVKEKDPVTGRVVKRRVRNNEQQIYEGKHDGLISEEQFYKVRQIYGSQAPAKMNTELVNPLSGLLVCRKCGRGLRYIAYNNGAVPRYHHNNSSPCKVKSLAASLIIDSIVESLHGFIEDFSVKMENDNDQTELIRHQTMIDTMEKELSKLEAKKRRMFDSWEADDGTYTKDEFIERKQMYDHSIEEMKQQIKVAKSAVPAPVDYEEQIRTIHSIIDCIQDPSISAQEKNDFLKQYIDKITYDLIDFGRGKGGKPILEVFLK